MRMLVLFIALLICTTTYSVILHIPADFSLIQDAIHSSEVGDTILVQPGEYYENIDFGGKDIVVTSEFIYTQDMASVFSTVINGNNNSCVVNFSNFETSNAQLTGFTLAGGTGEEDVIAGNNGRESRNLGGGIYCYNASPTLSNLLIKDSQADDGAGIFLAESNAEVSNVIIRNCSANQSGGAITTYNSDIQISNSVIENNDAVTNGGGIYTIFSNIEIIDSEISNNSTSYSGGGIEVNGSSIEIRGSSINNNNADDFGGAIQLRSSDLSMHTTSILENNSEYGGGLNAIGTNVFCDSVTITNNFSVTSCGGFRVESGDSLVIRNSLIDGNVSDLYTGGGAVLHNGKFKCYNTIFSENRSRCLSGGLGVWSDSIELNKVSIINNTSDSEGESPDECYGGGALTADSITVEKCLFANNTADRIGALKFAPEDFGRIVNCTFYNNNVLQESVFNSTIRVFGEGLILNSILYNDINHEVDTYHIASGYFYVENSLVKNGEDGIIDNYQFTWSTTNIDSNPMLDENFIPQEYSPCIDAGTNYFELNGEIILDLAESEYIGDAIDIGALESPFIVHNENTNIANFDGITISNYPNPFNPSTTIKFSLPIDENVNLSIYNVKGQKIKTLSNDRFNSGKHSIVWNGRDESNNAVSSGIYFYKLATDNQTIVKKCIMMK